MLIIIIIKWCWHIALYQSIHPYVLIGNFHFKNSESRLGNSSLSTVLALKAQGPMIDNQSPQKKLGMVVQIYNPIAVVAEPWGSLDSHTSLIN